MTDKPTKMQLKMKKIASFILALCATATIFAQAPQSFGYQTVVRNSNNVALNETPVGARLTILKNSATGTSVYSETQNVTTSSNGVATFEVGKGTVVSGVFAEIEWFSAKHFLKVEIDPDNGTNYTIAATTELKSVPYAMFSQRSVLYSKLDSLTAQLSGRLASADSLLAINSDSLRHIDSLILIRLYSDSVFYGGIGKFSTTDTTYISFSPANLWYRASDTVWEMPANQWDTTGQVSNSQLAVNYSGWVDMFAWGTSGINGILPTDTSFTGNYYGNGYSSLNGTGYDWGYHNPIAHRDTSFMPDTWRTPSDAELTYIFNQRPNASNLLGFATVNGIHGLVLLPDDWPGTPFGCSFVPRPVSWDVNVYSGIFWTVMENQGAVFLPAEGYLHRSATPMHCHDQGMQGFYWSETSSTTNDSDAYYLDFGIMYNALGPYNVLVPSNLCGREYNHNVRLVKDCTVPHD